MDQPSILVVEDDYQLQKMIEDALGEGGFLINTVATAEEVLTLFTGNPGAHRSLVTDINLRGRLSGWDAARRVREIVPDLPVIYMTGAAGDQWPSQGVPGSILLAKPFAPAQLVTAVSQLLTVRDAHFAGGPGVTPASILLVEDEALIRMMVAEMVEELGHRVAAEAGTLEAAIATARDSAFDVALLDVNLGGFAVTPVARIVHERGLPFIFASGYGGGGIPEEFRERPVLQKPFMPDALKRQLDAILDR